MPWNRRMQIVHGALRLAAAHETPAAFNPNLTKYYDDLVQRNVMDFLGALNTTRGRVDGMDIFNWDYVSPTYRVLDRVTLMTKKKSAMEEHTEESKGIHALCELCIRARQSESLLTLARSARLRRYPRQLEIMAAFIGYLLLVQQLRQNHGSDL